MDWFGGGLRLWVLARHVMPRPPLKGMILAGGMGAWGSYVTPLQSGAAPMLLYTMRRYGVPLPVGVTCTFLSFVATVAFFAIAGWLAILAGAGRSLGQKGNVLGLSLYDLFLGTLWIIGAIALYSAMTAGQSGIAHLAHLGGMVFGYLYLRGAHPVDWVKDYLDRRRLHRLKRRFHLYPGGKDDDRGPTVH